MASTFLQLFMLITILVSCSLIKAELPTPVDAKTARKLLAELTVKADSNTPAYDRAKFGKSWITTVLDRDGKNVKTDPKTCNPISGTWISPYDEPSAETNNASKLDIDHVVPLKEAWVSGAKDWDDDQRIIFANDLKRPQLVAVSDSQNRKKGSKADVTGYLPPRASFVCTYVRAWVHVKHHYGLTIDAAEEDTLKTELAKC
ncbi:hypothetical protein CVT24_003650 [Panaeolus cyanescens]|uniref:GmrSD restriction endonucleases C-terminal domain-containing protein n=1 Tax=Panaeolus cyanescens TaxID=181874 RepID=A0A409W8K0_9AGAR|nr:hypothetical protein CVT24_003650 [Panaeolus cyanescens]